MVKACKLRRSAAACAPRRAPLLALQPLFFSIENQCACPEAAAGAIKVASQQGFVADGQDEVGHQILDKDAPFGR